MFTCTKKYTDIPFAHRQWKHKGHCAMIHGHNWSFEFTFGASNRDENGFVVDFGSLRWLKQWLEQTFDHKLLLCLDDPKREQLCEALNGFADIVNVVDTSAEGLAHTLWVNVAPKLAQETKYRVCLLSVTVYEDGKNSATYSKVMP